MQVIDLDLEWQPASHMHRGASDAPYVFTLVYGPQRFPRTTTAAGLPKHRCG